MSTLSDVRDNVGARNKSKRLGRGIGSGKGKTSGKGVKGQKAREGVSLNGFEGGQLPIYRRLPKRGFTPLFKKDFVILKLANLQDAYNSGLLKSGDQLDEDGLVLSGVIPSKKNGVKILADGKISIPLFLTVSSASAKAILLVTGVGGDIKVNPA